MARCVWGEWLEKEEEEGYEGWWTERSALLAGVSLGFVMRGGSQAGSWRSKRCSVPVARSGAGVNTGEERASSPPWGSGSDRPPWCAVWRQKHWDECSEMGRLHFLRFVAFIQFSRGFDLGKDQKWLPLCVYIRRTCADSLLLRAHILRTCFGIGLLLN